MRIGLTLSNADRLLLWQPLGEGLTTVGRNPECDLCIPDAGVASIHTLLRREGDVVTLVNREPKGTRVGDEIVHGELRLAHGDTVHLGLVTATVHFEKEEAGSTESHTRTLTGAVPPNARRLWLTAPEALPGRVFEVCEPGLGIGSDRSNDVVLDDPYVSGFHARLRLEGGRIIVRDLQSRNGVFVAERKVREGEVPPGAQLRLGRTVLVVAADSTSAEAGPPVLETRTLVGKSAAMEAVRDRIRRVAASSAPVLVLGETGTGKEVAARLIAALGARAARGFVALNCGALGKSLIASELFGHEKGAFTGAVARKPGAFEAAHGGTLFLDEIGELPIDLQPQLLRVLESGEVRRVGATETFRVDVRFVAATHRRLEQEVAAGNFREDLYHRLHVLVIELPNLRQRSEDIPTLAQHFVTEFTAPGETITLSPEAVARLLDHPWPGNVRELRNTIQRAVLMRCSNVLEPADVTFTASTLSSRLPTAHAAHQRTLYELEREAIITELVRHGGNKTEAAAALGLSRSTIHRKIEEYRLDVDALLAAHR